MQIHVRSDSTPIYQQIVDQVRHRIVAGLLKPGEEMPTIRGLAQSLRVNPNTIQRAYRELENEGLVEKRRTRGTFVSESPTRQGVRERRRLLIPHVDHLLVRAEGLGIDFDELVDLLDKRRQKILSDQELSS
ncbi:GntR family transcriptional regulator [Crateriforma spongiae]|uniref:GntR family transcriptional regulator n=1 Tax=Crateriforma spongiae TaxID=2724528 RepID=UPI001445004A|nr:GntR family transcriptional regulator [Crateriforma spongiae]